MLVNVFSENKTVNFKLSYTFDQIALFCALPMVKKNLTHPKAAKLSPLLLVLCHRPDIYLINKKNIDDYK